MDFRIEKKTMRSIVLVILGIVTVYWVLNETSKVSAVADWITGILSPFVIGSVLAFILNVPMRAFEKLFKGIKNQTFRRVCALLAAIIAVIMIFTLVILLLVPQVSNTIQSLIPKLQTFLLQIEAWFNKLLAENPEIVKLIDIEKFDWASLVQNALNIVGNSVSTIFASAISAIGSLTSGFITAFIALAFSVYSLFQKETLARQGRKVLYAFLPQNVSDYLVRVLRLANSTFSNFLSGQCVEVCILGMMFAVTMAIFQMPYIPLVSVLVAVTAFIPVVGAWVGCIIGAFLILVANPLQAVWFVIMFVVLQQIENNVVYPRVVGTSIGLSGMWVLVAVALGGELMGVAGMFLMIPLTSVLYVLLREWIDSRLQKREIPAEKLQAQPPELRSRFKENREKQRKKLELDKLMKKISPKKEKK